MLDDAAKARMQLAMKEKAEKLKREMKEEQQNVQAQSKAHTSQIKKELRKAKNEKADNKSDEAVKKMVDYAAQIRQAGYDSWLSAEAEIVAMCRLLVDVKPLNLIAGGIAEIGFSAIEQVTGKIADKLSGGYGHPGVNLRPGAILDAVTSGIENMGKKPANLAVLQHYIEFKADPAGNGDILNLATIGTNMRRSDGKDFTPEQEANFQDTLRDGMVLWLDANGYDALPNPPGAFVVSGTLQRLTTAEFNDLRDDPDRGLDAFLSGAYDMTFEQASGPRPSPSPRP